MRFKLSCLTAIFIAASLPGWAQNPALPYQIASTPNGSVVTITNRTDSPVTALVLSAMCGPNEVERFEDLVMLYHSPSDTLIAVGETKEFRVSSVPTRIVIHTQSPLDKSKCEGKFEAAAFADGTATGDQTAISRIAHRRSVLREEIEQNLVVLNASLNTSRSLQDVLTALEAHHHTTTQAARNRDDGYAIDSVYSNVAANLRGTAPMDDPNLPHVDRINSVKSELENWLTRLGPAVNLITRN